ncbi:hypothetical protein C2G38_2034511 [Gigaspora rosea]|uniref:Secreted protein n=1 Tax=Gigaspora rosea TaxID=44941 RepID=A0A397VIY3_9GLOM|nr:hypothetical protein C2G38_2034511 [Gigaspora rosea]
MKIISIFMLTFILFVAIAIVFADKDDDDDDDDKEIYFLFLDKRSSSLLNEQKRDNETCPNQEKRFSPKQSAINQSENNSKRHFDHKRDLPIHSEAYRNLAIRQIRDAKTVPYYSYKRESTPYNYCRRDSDPLTTHYNKRDISSAR